MQFLAIALVLIISVVAVLVLPGRIARAQQQPAPSASSEQKNMAMCYDISLEAFVSEYVCPKCGEKTDYPKKDPLIDSVPDCRREVHAMKAHTKFGLALDESACCERCSPKSTGPALALVVTYPDKSTQTIRPIKLDELKRLHEFFQGKLSADALAKQSDALAKAAPGLKKAVETKWYDTVLKKESIRSMSRDQIESMLRNIATSKAPKDKMGAMCYSVMPGPNTVEYVCPICGEKTLYGELPEPKAPAKDAPEPESASKKETESPIDEAKWKAWQSVWLIDRELPTCRREIASIRALEELDVALDESALCAKCSPNAKRPQLALVVTYRDGTKHRTAPVSDWDLRMLRDFLREELAAETFNDGSIALKNQLPRLRELLGVDKKPAKKPSEKKPESPQS